MICIYEANCTDFSNNGLGVLLPKSCTVTEALNGEYELTLVHPLDENGRWKRLVEGCIIRAPVPAAMTPKVNLVNLSKTEIYRVTTKGGRINLRAKPSTDAKRLKLYRNGTEVIMLNKTSDDFWEVIAPDGKRGYMSAKYLTYDRTEEDVDSATNKIVEQTQQRDQPFRIYRIVPDLEKITVYARHIFYDLLDNMLQKYAPTMQDTGAKVMQDIAEACLSNEHGFTFYSDLESTAENFMLENMNPVDAILGDEGIAESYGGELARDWYDVYLVQRVGKDTDVQIRERKNLTGISYDVDTSSVVTRIMPTGEDKDGEILYLPEVFVDSKDHFNDYPHPKWIHIDVSEAKEVTSGDDKKSKEQCYKEMREAANKEFGDGCDMPDVTLKVDFVNCAEVEEYAQYRALQNIYLGDAVRVIAKRIGVEVSMRMTQYTYDCLARKYTDMTLGTIADTIEGNSITSRQIPSNSISGSKLVNGSVGSQKLAVDSVQARNIAAGVITADKIASGAITAGKIQTNALDAIIIEAVKADIKDLNADNINTSELYAALANITVLAAGTATFDQATVKHLISSAMNLEFGEADRVYITNLAVMYAQLMHATIADLCIKASDGNYYTLDVNQNGHVTAVKSTITDGEISTGQTFGGKIILETSMTVENLNTSNLLGTYALISRIDAAKIDVGELFAREAFIALLRTSRIIGDKSITLIAEQSEQASRSFRQNGEPTGAKAGDIWIQPDTGSTYQAESAEDAKLRFAIDREGKLYFSAEDENVQFETDDFDLFCSGVRISENPDGTLTAPFRWALVQDESMLADIKSNKDYLDRVIRIDPNGLHVGDSESFNEVLVDSDGVNVVVGGQEYSKFAGRYVQFGNYKIGLADDEGLMFKPL